MLYCILSRLHLPTTASCNAFGSFNTRAVRLWLAGQRWASVDQSGMTLDSGSAATYKQRLAAAQATYSTLWGASRTEQLLERLQAEWRQISRIREAAWARSRRRGAASGRQAGLAAPISPAAGGAAPAGASAAVTGVAGVDVGATSAAAAPATAVALPTASTAAAADVEAADAAGGGPAAARESNTLGVATSAAAAMPGTSATAAAETEPPASPAAGVPISILKFRSPRSATKKSPARAIGSHAGNGGASGSGAGSSGAGSSGAGSSGGKRRRGVQFATQPRVRLFHVDGSIWDAEDLEIEECCEENGAVSAGYMDGSMSQAAM